MEPQVQPMKPPTHSASLKEFAAAMCEVQKNDLFAAPDAMNYYKRGFASLQMVWKTIRKPLTNNGFSVIQTNSAYEGGIAITTTLLHRSGEWMRGTIEMPAEKKGPQAYGSAMSYARRYSLMAMVGVSTADDDDDAESATDRTDQKKSVVSKTVITERQMIPYKLFDEDSQAMTDLKEYQPDVVILNKENTKLRVGKYNVEINRNGMNVWSDVPKFNDANFDVSTCVPCMMARLVREHGKEFVAGKYGIKITEEISDDK